MRGTIVFGLRVEGKWRWAGGNVGGERWSGLALFLWFRLGKGAAAWVRVEGTVEREEEEQAAGWVGGGWLGSDGFRFRVLFMLSPQMCKIAPLFVCVEGSIYRQKYC